MAAGASEVQIPLIHLNDIVLEEVPIGRGGFGTVYRGKHNLFGLVAVKTLIDNGLLPQRQTKALQAEAKKLLEICHHPNILNIYGLIMEKDNYSLILEYMPLGSLSEFRKEFTVRWPLMIQILKDVISGMDFLHAMEPPVFHLDLKADNVLLEGRLHAKLCDFGLSEWKTVTVNINRNMDKSGRRCTTSHLPPEVWANVNRAPDAYYDIFSFGIVIWELLSGSVPYGSQSDDVIRSAVLSGQRPDFTLFPKDTPPKLSGMMTRSWHQKPAQRPSFSTLKTEIEKIFTEEYEKQVIPSLKLLRQEIVQNFESNDPLWTSTVYIETLQEPIEDPEPQPEPEPQPSGSSSTSEQSAQPTPASSSTKRPSQPAEQEADNLPVEVKLFKLDKDLSPTEKQLRRILRDPVAMRLAKSNYIRDLFHVSEATQNILNDSNKLNKIIESDSAFKWELYYAKNDIKLNLSGIHLEMAEHRAKTYLEINKDDIDRVFRSSSWNDHYGGYGYTYGSRTNERSEREKRRDRVDTCIRNHPHIRDLQSGGNFYRLKKALENPHQLEKTMKEKDTGGSSLSSLKLSTLDPEVIDIAKDPLLLLTILRDKDDIMRNLYEHYPKLLCELIANAKRKWPLPSGGYIDPPRSRMRGMFPPSMERDMMMGLMDPDEMMMMREMELRHRMRRHPGDSDSDEDDYPGMMGGMGMHRRMRMMRDMKPSKMDSMMRHMEKASRSMASKSAMMEPAEMARSSSPATKSEPKEEKRHGIMGMLKNTLFGKSDSGKKKNESEDNFKKPEIKPNVTRSSSTSSSSSSSSSSNVAIADANVPLVNANVPLVNANVPLVSANAASSQAKTKPTVSTTTKTGTSASSATNTSATTTTSATSATSSAKTSAKPSATSTTSTSAKPSATSTTATSAKPSTTSTTSTATSVKLSATATAVKPSAAPSATVAPSSGSAVNKTSSSNSNIKDITVPKVIDTSDVEMTVPKSVDGDLEVDTIPSLAVEPMEVDLSINRQNTTSASGGQQRQQSQPSATGSQQQSKGKQPQVRSRPISDNTTPPPSGPKKAKTTIEADAVPGSASSGAPVTAASEEPNSFTIGTENKTTQAVEHHHGDGGTTYMKWDKASRPNVQIGHRNMMVIGDDLNEDPWSIGPMPQRRQRERKKKELVLTKSTRLVNQSEMDDLAQGLGRDWKKLKRYLNIPEAIIEQIELDYQREGLHEVIYQLLRKWKEMRGSMATIATLAEALHKIGRNDLAETLK